jgi:outer membrane lipoprotein-sorting protein
MKTLALAMLVASPLAAQTADTILDKHFAALGGKDKIAAIQSAKISAKQVFGPQEVPATILWKRPSKIRMEFTLQGLTGIQAYDGKDAWQVMPFLGKNDPEAMAGDDLKDIIDQADMIEGPLFNYKEKGNTVELLGKESIEGTDAWKLKLTQKNGDVSTIWLDADAYLQIKSEGKRKRGDQEMEFEQAYGDYKEVGGILFAHSIESKPKGAPQGATITIESIELGVDLPDSLFVMPPKPEAAKPASGAQG